MKAVGGNITKLILPYNMLYNITMNLYSTKICGFLHQTTIYMDFHSKYDLWATFYAEHGIF